MIKWHYLMKLLCIVYIMSNFIPNETMIFDDSDPPWLNKNIKNMMYYKNAIYKKLVKRSSGKS